MRPIRMILPPVLAGLALPLAADPGPLEFFSNSPAGYSSQTSNEAFPVGNGKLAAMIYGDAGDEIIQFNEDTVWAGTVNDYSHPGAVGWLDDIRGHVWNGAGEDAYNLAARDHFMSVPLRQSPYQPAGNLRIDTGHDSVSNYRRTLDLGTATARVEYRAGGVDHTREVYASYPDQVIVIRLTASESASINCTYSFDTVHTRSSKSIDGTDLVLDAQVNVDIDSRRQQTSDVHFQSRVRVLNEGGTVSPGGSSVTVSGANAVTLLLSVASNHVRFDDLSGDPGARVRAILDAADDKTAAQLRADQLADYQELFERVTIDLGTTSRSHLPIDQRLEAIDVGANTQEARAASLANDLQLVALNFQMGRYLMISGSRPGSQPLNLQGKWNNEVNPAWESKMTLNINQEMNYWVAEVGNLGECHVPMVDLVHELSESGAAVAAGHYGADGWMVHHNTDLWRGAAPINNPGGLWPAGGAWLSMHLWWHYQHSQDPAVLAEIYPLMKGAAEFFDDFLVMDPRAPTGSNPQWGQYLLTNPTHSPEQPQPALGDDGEIVAGTTMDSQLIRGLYDQVIEASTLLGVDAELRDTWQAKRDLLPPNQIGRHGQLQEWLEDVDQSGNQHRHLSHLVAMFPGDEITPQHTPALADAVEVVLGWKGNATNNTAWSQAWKMNLWSALGDGDVAFGVLANLFAKSHTDNMTFSRKGNENQIDGNLGAAAGIPRMFLQSDRGEIELLPALPARVPQGSVTGLKARGGCEVDVEWDAGSLTEARIRPVVDGPCRVRSAVPVRVHLEGVPVPGPEVGDEVYEFASVAGAEYVVAPGEPFVGSPDADDDGLADEVETGTGVFVSPDDTGSQPDDDDSDDDGLRDGEEVNVHGTNPNRADSDGDGVSDRVELELAGMGLDPLVDSASWLGLLDANGPALGLFTAEQLRRSVAGRPILGRPLEGDELEVVVHLWETPDLFGWSEVDLETGASVDREGASFRIGLERPGARAFFRFGLADEAIAPGPPLPEFDPTDADLDGIPDAAETSLAVMGFDPGTDSASLRQQLVERAEALGRFGPEALRVIEFAGPSGMTREAGGAIELGLGVAVQDAGGTLVAPTLGPDDVGVVGTELRLTLPWDPAVEVYQVQLPIRPSR